MNFSNRINEGFDEEKPDVSFNSIITNKYVVTVIYLLIFGLISYVIYKVSKKYKKAFDLKVKKAVFNSNFSIEEGKDSYFFGNIFLKIIFIILLIINFLVFIAYNYSYISEVNLKQTEDKMYLSDEEQQNIEKLKKNKKIGNIIENINYYSAISLIIFIIISVCITNRKEILNSINGYINKLIIKKNKNMLETRAN